MNSWPELMWKWIVQDPAVWSKVFPSEQELEQQGYMLQSTYRFACIYKVCFNNSLPLLAYFFCDVWFYYICIYTYIYTHFFTFSRQYICPLVWVQQPDSSCHWKMLETLVYIWKLRYVGFSPLKSWVETSDEPWDHNSAVWFDKKFTSYIKKMKDSRD